jgi:hypothetical protein
VAFSLCRVDFLRNTDYFLLSHNDALSFLKMNIKIKVLFLGVSAYHGASDPVLGYPGSRPPIQVLADSLGSNAILRSQKGGVREITCQTGGATMVFCRHIQLSFQGPCVQLPESNAIRPVEAKSTLLLRFTYLG